jgi:hypothetical protein
MGALLKRKEAYMKKFILCLMIVLVPSLLFAGRWCQWSGTEGENCKSTSRTYIIINGGRVSVSAENLNPRGWYELTVTQPTIGTNEVKDVEVWDLVNDEMSKTWTVRAMTAEEIDTRDERAMSVNSYCLWKALIVTGVITQQQAIDNLPARLVDAYQARGRLGGCE